MANVKPLKTKTAPAPKASHRTRIVVDPKDGRVASVVHDRKVIFTIRTDESGMYPSIIIAATDTYLKSMEKGRMGIILWNGGAGLEPRGRKLH
jgi:hypothetical protein